MKTAAAASLALRLGDATACADDAEDVARALFAVLPATIPHVFACLATMDPAHGLITGAFKSHELEIGDEEFAAAEYGGPDVNLLAEVATRRVPVAVLSIDTGGRTETCRRFRELMAPRFGFTDELRLVCRSQDVVWGALALYRGPGDPPFTRQEASALGAVHELLAVALQRTLLPARPGPSTAPVPLPVPPVVLVLDDRDRLTGASGAAEPLIEQLGGRDHGSLPAALLAPAAAARAAAAPAASRVRTRSGEWLAVRAVPVVSPTGDRSVVLTMDGATRTAVAQLGLAARGLTARETEVVEQVLQGASTKQIAASLHLSAHTVQDHLKAVFAKLGVSSRREVVAQFVD